MVLNKMAAVAILKLVWISNGSKLNLLYLKGCSKQFYIKYLCYGNLPKSRCQFLRYSNCARYSNVYYFLFLSLNSLISLDCMRNFHLELSLYFQVSADARGPYAKQRGGPIKRPPQKSQKPTNCDDHNNPMTQVLTSHRI